MVARMPRVVIIGAGMAGITAASQLQRETSSFELTVLEASHTIGGRICTSQFGGDLIELGATWIHGVEGSPVYEIAEKIGALKGDTPWERQDGFPPMPVVRAEGGLAVDSAIVQPMRDLYKKMMLEIRTKGKLEKGGDVQHVLSIGTFLRQGFTSFVSQPGNFVSDDEERFPEGNGISFEKFNPPIASGWTLSSLQDAAFSIQENMERICTSANSLCDLDLEAEQEYKEYPGDQITIGKGYISVVNKLASFLPAGTIQFGKEVQKLVWDRSPGSDAPVLIHCSDGSLVEADHVIITVSLGVLKAGILPAGSVEDFPWAGRSERPVCRSGIPDLKHGSPVVETRHALFDPPLPLRKVEAIGRLGYGVVDKLFLLLNESRREQLRSHVELMYKRGGVSKEGSGCPWWMRKTCSIAPIYEGSDVLLLWFAGEEAMEVEGLSDEEIMCGVEETLAEFGVVGKRMEEEEGGMQHDGWSSCSDSEERWEEREAESMFGGVLRSRWGRNPLYQGSYSFVATGSSGVDIETVSEPLHGHTAPLQLLFAGEATDRHFYSTTHGAHLSGLREANRLLQHYGFHVDSCTPKPL